jgi:hypothetical protein
MHLDYQILSIVLLSNLWLKEKWKGRKEEVKNLWKEKLQFMEENKMTTSLTHSLTNRIESNPTSILNKIKISYKQSTRILF